jgi:hypothetical protein
MIEIQRISMVQETCIAFQDAMQDKFIKAVERLSGTCWRSSQTTTSAPTSRLSYSYSRPTGHQSRTLLNS